MKLNELLGMSRLDQERLPGKYLLWSTAPLNVEDPLDEDERRGGQQGIEELFCEVVDRLATTDEPQVVLHIHGFNNPKKVSYKAYLDSADFIKDRFETMGEDFVYIGYQWPSEKLFGPAATFFSSMPRILMVLIALLIPVSALFVLASTLVRNFPTLGGGLALFSLLGAMLLFSLPFSLFLLRALVYFRDFTRANNHGVPDIVEFVRRLELALCARGYDKQVRQGSRQRVRMSVVGHSMGSVVTTNMVRILSDAFKPSGVGENPCSEDDSDKDKSPGSELGETLELSRLILVSPDLPAEMLMTRRANYLASSLRRFKEAYLFTNEGDVVVRYIAGLANYFSLPTRTRARSYRLANVMIDSDEYGIVNRESFDVHGRIQPIEDFLKLLRVGDLSFLRLEELKQGEEPPGEIFATKFTYFDCTDYVEGDRSFLSYASRRRAIGFSEKTKLLVFYLLGMPKRWHRDVHSGYFDSEAQTARTLIFGLACLGMNRLLAHLDPEPGNRWAALSVECEKHGIQVLLSPRTDERVVLGNLAVVRKIGGP